MLKRDDINILRRWSALMRLVMRNYMSIDLMISYGLLWKKTQKI